MANFFNIKLSPTSTSPGLYTIYYDTISNSTICINEVNSNPATDLTLNELLLGVVVRVPDPTTKIILYNQTCKTFQEFDVDPKLATYPCICVIIFDKISGTSDKIEGCYGNTSINGKPLYVGTGVKFVWLNNYWEMSGFTKSGVVFRSNDLDDVPNSSWYGAGVNSDDFVLYAQTGTCSSVVSNNVILIADGTDATCSNDDGSIIANALGGLPPWEYSKDGVIYQTLGIFNQLPSGVYPVHARDSNGSIIVETITINNPPINFFTLQASSIQTNTLSKIGNVQYYSITVTYDTNEIPLNQNIVFDYEIIYTLKYNSPGFAEFITDQNILTKNSVLVPFVSTGSQDPIPVSPVCLNYNTYDGFRSFQASSISLTKNNTFELNLTFGIDTQTGGAEDNGCRTEAFLYLTANFKNVQLTCNCCGLNNNTVNLGIPPQIYV